MNGCNNCMWCDKRWDRYNGTQAECGNRNSKAYGTPVKPLDTCDEWEQSEPEDELHGDGYREQMIRY